MKIREKFQNIQELMIQKVFDKGHKELQDYQYLYEYQNICLEDNNLGLSVSASTQSIQKNNLKGNSQP